MAISVVPFAEPGRERRSALAIAVGVAHPVDATRREEGSERVDVLAAVFDAETGKRHDETRTSLNVVMSPTDARDALFEVMSRLRVQPGRYQVRVGLRLMDGATSSLYSYVDVPDFGRQPLTASGLLLGVTPAPVGGPLTLFQDLAPILPTSRREFRASDVVTLFGRVYRRPSDRRLEVPRVTTTITDTSNVVIAERIDRLPADAWEDQGTADYKLALPLSGLAAGDYLLNVDFEAGSHQASRVVRFSVAR